MAENNNPANGAENNNGAQNNEGAVNNNGTRNMDGAQEERKYTETDMNNISKKNSEKAVNVSEKKNNLITELLLLALNAKPKYPREGADM